MKEQKTFERMKQIISELSEALVEDYEKLINQLKPPTYTSLQIFSLSALFLLIDRLYEQTERLVESSIKLEKLTRVLVVLTIILAILTGINIFLILTLRIL